MDNNTTSHPLATESFSFSWLETESSQHKTFPNNNNNHLLLLDETTHNFYFDTSNSASLVHADKLFSNGLILPQFLDEPSKNNATSSIIVPSSSNPSPLIVNSETHDHQSSSFPRIVLAKCSKLCRWETLSKYATCLIPMKESIGRGATRVDDVNRLTWEVNKNWSANSSSNNNNNNNNNNAFDEVASYSPRKEFGAYSSVWSDVDEGSIRDAIIYCKRSNGLY